VPMAMARAHFTGARGHSPYTVPRALRWAQPTGKGRPKEELPLAGHRRAVGIASEWRHGHATSDHAARFWIATPYHLMAWPLDTMADAPNTLSNSTATSFLLLANSSDPPATGLVAAETAVAASLVADLPRSSPSGESKPFLYVGVGLES
jgi:hypothetical protein